MLNVQRSMFNAQCSTLNAQRLMFKSMTRLYSTLATVYHEMYQHIFDYEAEFNFYDALLSGYHCHTILEIGCGTGMLARRFINSGYDYMGLDLHDEMLDIARAEVTSGKFIQGDMRKLSFHQQFDSILITGRSISYILKNQGIIDTLAGVYKALKENGLLIFGIFEANGIFDNFDEFEQTILLDHKKIVRTNTLKKNLKTGWTYDWHAKYTIEQDNEVSVYEDLTTLRAFTKDEISLFLKMTGFETAKMIEENKVITLVAVKKQIITKQKDSI
jgi:SAM-dependent methyltransferase